MEHWFVVVIAGAADAAGIDEQPAIDQPDRAWNMGVAAEDDGKIDPLGETFYALTGGHMYHALGRQVFQPIGEVVLRRAMAEKEFLPVNERRGQGA